MRVSDDPAGRLLIREGRPFDAREKQISKLAKQAKEKMPLCQICHGRRHALG